MSLSTIAFGALTAGFLAAQLFRTKIPKRSTKPARKTVLVTGGAGYIGSHTVILLVNAGYDVVVFDNMSNSSVKVIDRIKSLVSRPTAVTFVQGDVLDRAALKNIFSSYCFHAVLHFASLKAVAESISKPLLYYRSNLVGAMNVIEEMIAAGCKRFVFSSSATVYGDSPSPVTEESRVGQGITNPYGKTKYMLEEVIRDTQAAYPDLCIAILRYFNPVGAHKSGLIGEDPQGIPNNLMPYVLQVAIGRRPQLTVFGQDYATDDGTAERDFIHIMDLAQGHISALNWLNSQSSACEAFNLGTGSKVSVMQLVAGVEAASGRPVNRVIGPRRSGDLECVYARADKAKRVLGWEATHTLQDMCEDSWRWQFNNPKGFN